MNRRNNLSVIVISALSILVGCKETEVIQTVDWYKTHEKERKEMLTKCSNNPGKLANAPNCINAYQAETTMPSDIKKSRTHAKPPEFN